MTSQKFDFRKKLRIAGFALGGLAALSALMSFLSALDSLTFSRTLLLLGIVIAAWIIATLFVKNKKVFDDGTTKGTIKKLGPEYHVGFATMSIVLIAWLIFGVKAAKSPNIVLSPAHDPNDTVLRVTVFPLRGVMKSNIFFIDYESLIKEYLEETKDSNQYTFHILFAKPDSAEIPVTENEAIKAGERLYSDLVIWGSFEDRIDSSGFRVRYALTKNYHGIVDSSKRTGDSEMQTVTSLRQIRKGDLLKNVEYILNWTEGIAAYQKYDFTRAIKYFEKTKSTVNAEEYETQTNILLANLYQELGQNNTAFLYCKMALKKQELKGDTTSSQYAALLINCGSTLDRPRYADSALDYIQKGLSILEASSIKDSLNLAIGYIEWGRVHYDSSGFARLNAAPKYEKALQFLDSLNANHIPTIVLAKYNLATIYSDFSYPDEGLVLLKTAWRFQSALSPTDFVMNSYIFALFGTLYSQKRWPDSSNKYFRLADNILSTKLHNYYRRAALFSNIGNLHNNFGEIDTAQKYFQIAKSILIDNKDTVSVLYGEINVNLSENFKKKGNFPVALELEYLAERIFTKALDSNAIQFGYVYVNIAEIACELKAFDLAENYLSKAWKYFLRTTLNKNGPVYNTDYELHGYYYWHRAKFEMGKGNISNAKENMDKAYQTFLRQNYPDNYDDWVKFRIFRNKLNGNKKS